MDSWVSGAKHCGLPAVPVAMPLPAQVGFRCESRFDCHPASCLQVFRWLGRNHGYGRPIAPGANVFANSNDAARFYLWLAVSAHNGSSPRKNAKRLPGASTIAADRSRTSNGNPHRFPAAIHTTRRREAGSRNKQAAFHAHTSEHPHLADYNRRAYRAVDIAATPFQTKDGGLRPVAKVIQFSDIANAAPVPERAEPDHWEQAHVLLPNVWPSAQKSFAVVVSLLQRRLPHMNTAVWPGKVVVTNLELDAIVLVYAPLRTRQAANILPAVWHTPLNTKRIVDKIENALCPASAPPFSRSSPPPENSSELPESMAYPDDGLTAQTFFHQMLVPLCDGGPAPKPPEFFALIQVEMHQHQKGYESQKTPVAHPVECPQPDSEAARGALPQSPILLQNGPSLNINIMLRQEISTPVMHYSTFDRKYFVRF